MSRNQSFRPHDLSAHARGLSSGTLATLTGRQMYAELDTIHDAFVRFCDRQARPHTTTWQDAWQRFWPLYTAPTGTRTLDALAQAIDQASATTQAQLVKEQIEAETRTRLRPRKTQAEPVGLFAQEQQHLFG